MKVQLAEITAEEKRFEYRIDAGRLDTFYVDTEGEYWRSSPDARVDVSLLRLGTKILLSIDLETEVGFSCSRCLERASLHVKARTDATLLARDDVAPSWSDEDHEMVEDELNVLLYSGEELDLDDLIRELLISELPAWPVCDEDCQGLCPNCGSNRNIESCVCQPGPRSAWVLGLSDIKLKE